MIPIEAESSCRMTSKVGICAMWSGRIVEPYRRTPYTTMRARQKEHQERASRRDPVD